MLLGSLTMMRYAIWQLKQSPPVDASPSQGFLKVATALPLPNVTRAHLPRGYDNYKPPLLHFGWSFDPDALLKWGAENGIDTTERCQEYRNGPVIEEPDSLSTVTTEEAMKVLAEKAGTPDLQLAFKLSVREGGHFIIAISSNYSFLKDRKSIAQGRIDTFSRYLKERGIVQDPPAWYLDYEHYMWRRIY